MFQVDLVTEHERTTQSILTRINQKLPVLYLPEIPSIVCRSKKSVTLRSSVPAIIMANTVGLYCNNSFNSPIFRVANFQTLVWDLRLCVILQTFQLLFLYMLQTTTFLRIPSRNQNQAPQNSRILTLFCKKNPCDPRKKLGKAAPPSWLVLCLGRLMACDNAYVKQFVKFPDFFETPCWPPCQNSVFNCSMQYCIDYWILI